MTLRRWTCPICRYSTLQPEWVTDISHNDNGKHQPVPMIEEKAKEPAK